MRDVVVKQGDGGGCAEQEPEGHDGSCRPPAHLAVDVVLRGRRHRECRARLSRRTNRWAGEQAGVQAVIEGVEDRRSVGVRGRVAGCKEAPIEIGQPGMVRQLLRCRWRLKANREWLDGYFDGRHGDFGNSGSAVP